MFFDDWQGLLRVLVVGVAAYAGVVAILRLSGKRTLAKMNAFDLVVTVALGSTLATILLTKDVALFEGLLAVTVLAGMQFALAWGAVRSSTVKRLAKSTPRRLVTNGAIDETGLREERITRDEILAAIRKAGFGELDAIAAVVLETDGSFSVIARTRAGSGSALP